MGRKLALIIGNSDYDDAGLARLLTPGADAGALAGVLRDPEVGGFDDVSALVNPSVAAVRRAIASFFVDRERDDLLLLYSSGHGLRDDHAQLYLAVKDTERPLLRGTALPAAYITEELDNSRSHRQVLILDCCHSGAFSRGMKGAPGLSVGTGTAFQDTGSGRVVLTASDATQYAWEGDQLVGQSEHSVFTQYLIQGLRSGAADADADGRITLDELYDYVYAQVVHETPKQTPSKWSYGQQLVGLVGLVVWGTSAEVLKDSAIAVRRSRIRQLQQAEFGLSGMWGPAGRIRWRCASLSVLVVN